ncbi:hypothetical protein EKL95_14235 [Flavobacterium sp. LB2P53]|nr:hypothetical protein EKL95_14235 [Flavobacterium sp. LB2P53]RTY89436.1 hypothetical protein EKL32_22900 [Flavobacterium sp. GSN2]
MIKLPFKVNSLVLKYVLVSNPENRFNLFCYDRNPHQLKGLSNEAVLLSRTKFGSNTIVNQNKNQFLKSLFEMVKELMFLLLLSATSAYFITSDYGN